MIAALEKMLASGQDTAVLRYSLATAYAKENDLHKAIEHLRMALTLDENYSAAWRSLGKLLTEIGDNQAAMETYTQGIKVADAQGDKQAAKEMRVFARRLTKQHGLIAPDSGTS